MSIEEEIEKSMAKIEQSSDNEEEQQTQGNNQEQTAQLNLHSFVTSIQRLTKLAGRKLGYNSMILNDDDAQELEYALLPLQDYIADMFKYLVFAPITIFAVGYGLGIYEEYKSKHPNPKKEIKDKKEGDAK